MGPLIWLVVLVGVVVLCVLVVVILREATRGRNTSTPLYPTGVAHPPVPSAPETPLAVLERRLAAGEIDIDEYQRVRRALTNPDG